MAPRRKDALDINVLNQQQVKEFSKRNGILMNIKKARPEVDQWRSKDKRDTNMPREQESSIRCKYRAQDVMDDMYNVSAMQQALQDVAASVESLKSDYSWNHV